MKALSLIQPWATLIMDGRKTCETRSWPTRWRGKVAIHSSKKIDKFACQDFGYDPKMLPTGSILGTAIIANCVQFPSELVLPDMYGNYEDGRFGFILTDVELFLEPIPARGALGLWVWEPK